MAILQALLAFIGRSAGKILNAIFGWAVRALFGHTWGSERTLLTGLVAAAALWPLLVLGTFAPEAAAFALAFVPLPDSVPSWIVRAVWIVLAAAMPALLGFALAAKRAPGTAHESFIVRLARGYPTTLGLALAFWISFVTVPFRQLAAMLRGNGETYFPLITATPESYEDAATRVQTTLHARGFVLARLEPPLSVRAPISVLRTLGGAALRDFVPARLVYMAGPDLETVLHPSGITLRGREQHMALARGLMVEALTTCEAFQTTDPQTQDLERQIRRVWTVLRENPSAHVDSRWLTSRLDDIAADIASLEANYDDWQIVYRQALQLGRALGGQPQLLARSQEEVMKDADQRIPSAAHAQSTTELMGELASKATQLVQKELELARRELKQDTLAWMAAIKAFVVAAVAGITALNLALVAAVFALLPAMAGWAAALVLAGAMALIAVVMAAIGWHKRADKPLDLTRKSLQEDVQWAKEEMA
jgi:hypothetical protein